MNNNKLNTWFAQNKDKNTFDKILVINDYINANFSHIVCDIKWNALTFSHNDNFIFGVSVANEYITITVEMNVIKHFKKAINKNKYESTMTVFKINEDQLVDLSLIDDIVKFVIEEKE